MSDFYPDPELKIIPHPSTPSTTLTAIKNRNLNKDWILIDNQSTIDMFFNALLLMSIRPVPTIMTVHTHADSSKCKEIVDLEGYNNIIWYDKNAIANILSLSRIKCAHHINFDRRVGKIFTVY